MSSSVIDISRNKETGEIEQFTVIDETGQPNLVKATPENMLLYDPANELPFENGMHGFLSGEQAIVLSDDPEVIVAPTNNEYCYILRVRGNTVETTPKQAQEVLQGVKDAAIDKQVSGLISLHDTIRSNQVRRYVVNALHETFEDSHRINETGSGWLIDDFYLVNWEASMYVKHDDPDEPDVRRSGSDVVETDRSREFVELNIRRDIDPIEVGIGGDTYRLTEREMLFLAKVKWLLNRRHFHPDRPFWMYADKRAAVDHITGGPESEESDDGDDTNDDGTNLDSFSL